jgi:hypothetical protein
MPRRHRRRKKIEDRKRYEHRSKTLVTVSLWIVLFFLPLSIYKTRFPVAHISFETMDEAQVARNLARGGGFTTNFIRPQLYRHFIRPVDMIYPPLPVWLLAQLPGIREGGAQKSPDGTVTGFFIFFYFATALLLFQCGKVMCNARIAFLSSLFYLFSVTVLQYAVNGSNVSLRAFIVTAYFLLVYLNKNESFVLSLIMGGFLGLCYLADYALLIMVVPLVIYILVRGGEAKYRHLLAMIIGLIAVAGPWMIRNLLCGGNAISGQPLSSLFLSSPLLKGREMENIASRFGLQLSSFCDMITHSFGSLVFAFFLVSPLIAYENPDLEKTKAIFWTSLLAVLLVSLLGEGRRGSFLAFSPVVILFGTKTFMEFLDRQVIEKEKLKRRLVSAFVIVNLIPFAVTVLGRGGDQRWDSIRSARLNNLVDMRDLMNTNDIVMTNAPEWLSYYGEFLTVPLPESEKELRSWQRVYGKLRYAVVCPYGRNGNLKRMVIRGSSPNWFTSNQVYRYPEGEYFFVFRESGNVSKG